MGAAGGTTRRGRAPRGGARRAGEAAGRTARAPGRGVRRPGGARSLNDPSRADVLEALDAEARRRGSGCCSPPCCGAVSPAPPTRAARRAGLRARTAGARSSCTRRAPRAAGSRPGSRSPRRTCRWSRLSRSSSGARATRPSTSTCSSAFSSCAVRTRPRASCSRRRRCASGAASPRARWCTCSAPPNARRRTCASWKRWPRSSRRSIDRPSRPTCWRDWPRCPSSRRGAAIWLTQLGCALRGAALRRRRGARRLSGRARRRSRRAGRRRVRRAPARQARGRACAAPPAPAEPPAPNASPLEQLEREARTTSDRSRSALLVREIESCYAQRGEPDGALPWVQRWVMLAPEEPEALRALARVHETLGREAELCATLEMLDPLLGPAEQAAQPAPHRRHLPAARATRGRAARLRARARARAARPRVAGGAGRRCSARAARRPSSCARSGASPSCSTRAAAASASPRSPPCSRSWATSAPRSTRCCVSSARTSRPADVPDRIEALLERTGRHEELEARLRARAARYDAGQRGGGGAGAAPRAPAARRARAQRGGRRRLPRGAAPRARGARGASPASSARCARASTAPGWPSSWPIRRATPTDPAAARAQRARARGAARRDARARRRGARGLPRAGRRARATAEIREEASERYERMLEAASEWETLREFLEARLAARRAGAAPLALHERLARLCGERLRDRGAELLPLGADRRARAAPRRRLASPGRALRAGGPARGRGARDGGGARLRAPTRRARRRCTGGSPSSRCTRRATRSAPRALRAAVRAEPGASDGGQLPDRATPARRAPGRRAARARVAARVAGVAPRRGAVARGAAQPPHGAARAHRARARGAGRLRRGDLGARGRARRGGTASADRRAAGRHLPARRLQPRPDRAVPRGRRGVRRVVGARRLVRAARRRLPRARAPARSGRGLPPGAGRAARGPRAPGLPAPALPASSPRPSRSRACSTPSSRTSAVPTRFPVRVELAELLAGPLDRPDSALLHARRVLQLAPHHPQAFESALAMALRLERPDVALEILDARLADARGDVERAALLARRARLLAGPLGRPDEAAERLPRRVALRPVRARAARRARARSSSGCERWDEVLAWLGSFAREARGRGARRAARARGCASPGTGSVPTPPCPGSSACASSVRGDARVLARSPRCTAAPAAARRCSPRWRRSARSSHDPGAAPRPASRARAPAGARAARARAGGGPGRARGDAGRRLACCGALEDLERRARAARASAPPRSRRCSSRPASIASSCTAGWPRSTTVRSATRPAPRATGGRRWRWRPRAPPRAPRSCAAWRRPIAALRRPRGLGRGGGGGARGAAPGAGLRRPPARAAPAARGGLVHRARAARRRAATPARAARLRRGRPARPRDAWPASSASRCARCAPPTCPSSSRRAWRATWRAAPTTSRCGSSWRALREERLQAPARRARRLPPRATRSIPAAWARCTGCAAWPSGSSAGRTWPMRSSTSSTHPDTRARARPRRSAAPAGRHLLAPARLDHARVALLRGGARGERRRPRRAARARAPARGDGGLARRARSLRERDRGARPHRPRAPPRALAARGGARARAHRRDRARAARLRARRGRGRSRRRRRSATGRSCTRAPATPRPSRRPSAPGATPPARRRRPAISCAWRAAWPSSGAAEDALARVSLALAAEPAPARRLGPGGEAARVARRRRPAPPPRCSRRRPLQRRGPRGRPAPAARRALLLSLAIRSARSARCATPPRAAPRAARRTPRGRASRASLCATPGGVRGRRPRARPRRRRAARAGRGGGAGAAGGRLRARRRPARRGGRLLRARTRCSQPRRRRTRSRASARALVALGDFASAREVLGARIERGDAYPERPRTACCSARCLEQLDALEEALAVYQSGAGRGSASTRRRSRRWSACTRRSATSTTASPRWSAGRAAPASRSERGQRLLRAAEWELRCSGREASAERHLREAVAAHPRLAAAWRLLIAQLLQQGRLEDAIEAADRAAAQLEVDADLAAIALLQARAHEERGARPEAAEVYGIAAEVDPRCSEAALAQARLLRGFGDWRAAAEALRASCAPSAAGGARARRGARAAGSPARRSAGGRRGRGAAPTGARSSWCPSGSRRAPRWPSC